MFFLALAASLSWRVLAGDPRRVTRQPRAAQASVTAGTWVGGCGAPSTVGEGSRAPGHSHPGFHEKKRVQEDCDTH